MELYHTTDHHGISELNPSTEKMRELLNSLAKESEEEEEHPDISLVHDPSGWSIGVYPSGIITLENLDDAEGTIRYMKNLPLNQVHKLWMKLSRGEITYINNQPWLPNEI